MTWTVDRILAEDLKRHPYDRNFPWVDEKDGLVVVVEPKQHMLTQRAFKMDSKEYCYYECWKKDGARARFFGHVSISGADMLVDSRQELAIEVAQGQWDDF